MLQLRRIFKLKTRKEDPRRYINVETEKVTSVYQELSGYVSKAVSWAKKIIYTNDDNSALPILISSNSFYSKPQNINRVYKRKLPEHLEESLNMINKGFTPANLAIQRLKHEKIVQQRMRAEAIQVAIQRRKAIEQQEFDKPRKIYKKFTIYYEDQKKPLVQEFHQRKISLALDLLRQEVEKTFDDFCKNSQKPTPNSKTTQAIPKPPEIEKKQEEKQIIKPIIEPQVQIEKPPTSPVQTLIMPRYQEVNVSKSNNPFIGTVTGNMKSLSEIINSNQQSSQLFTSNHQIQVNRQESISINNNQNHPSSNPFSTIPKQSRNNSLYNNSHQLQLPLPIIPEESSVSNYSLSQSSNISNQSYGNRSMNIPQSRNQNQQQNNQYNLQANNPPLFTIGINPTLMSDNRVSSSFFQSSSKDINNTNLFAFSDIRSQASHAKTLKKRNSNRINIHKNK